jgi:hypothetical protein
MMTIKLNFDKKAKLDYDKQAELDAKKIKKIKKESVEHRTYANPPPKAHAQKPNGGGYA